MKKKRKPGRFARLRRVRALRPLIVVSRPVRRALRRAPKRIRRAMKRLARQTRQVWLPRLLGRQRIPPPHAYKVSVVLAYAKRFGTRSLIETGTLRGDMVEATRTAFDHIWSIELDTDLHAAGTERFREYAHISMVHGDSAVALPEILRGQPQPILFWLDGHWSGGKTARGSLDTPVFAELTDVLARGNANDVILIDDARLFGTGDYPTIATVRAMIRAKRPEWQVDVRDDIIRAHRPDG